MPGWTVTIPSEPPEPLDVERTDAPYAPGIVFAVAGLGVPIAELPPVPPLDGGTGQDHVTMDCLDLLSFLMMLAG